MISRAEIRNLSVEWGLRDSVVEKDYVIGWVLWGICTHPILRDAWIFKGGTCLKKCYFETYRFSEDLDFTVIGSVGTEREDVLPAILEVLDRVREESGIDFSGSEPVYRLRPSGAASEVRIYYRGPAMGPQAVVKLDLNSAESVVRPPVLRGVRHPFSDAMPGAAAVRSYSFEELFAEKIRALGERSRPRDLYDVVSIHRNSVLRGKPSLVRRALSQKCESKGVPVPSLQAVLNSPYYSELESEWENMLGHQLPVLPPYEAYIEAMEEFFDWLEGRKRPSYLAPLPAGPDEDVSWVPPPTLFTWGVSTPLEPIRFAGANRLLIRIRYRKDNGQVVSRTVEPYALRRTKTGNVILRSFDLKRNDYRAFRIDRLQSAEVTRTPFRPRSRVELGRGLAAIPSTAADRYQSVYSRKSRTGRNGPTGILAKGGPTCIVECNSCGRRFSHSTRGAALKKHKDKRGYDCPGRFGHIVDVRY